MAARRGGFEHQRHAPLARREQPRREARQPGADDEDLEALHLGHLALTRPGTATRLDPTRGGCSPPGVHRDRRLVAAAHDAPVAIGLAADDDHVDVLWLAGAD